jgi:3-phenylpropionate/trans-cinnamate dioxygenase ferredoxin subunit
MNRVLAGSVEEYPQGAQKVIEVEDEYVLVVHSLSGFWAIEDRCSHDDNELFGGPVDERDGSSPSIKCLRHGARFDLGTGAALSLPAVRAVKSYFVTLEDGKVWVTARD